MDFTIEKVDRSNCICFEDMVYLRENGCERTQEDKALSRRIEEELKNSNLYIYAAKSDDKFVGWISIVYIPKISRCDGRGHIYVDELWVAENCRNKGIAKELLKKADRLKETHRASGIRLYCNMDNPIALNLYKKCGYTENGTAYFMEK